MVGRTCSSRHMAPGLVEQKGRGRSYLLQQNDGGRRVEGRAPCGSAGDGGDGEGVDEVVHPVAAVTLHPAPAHVVHLHQLDQRLPEIGIGDRLALGVPPAVLLPLDPPLVTEAVDDVGRIGDHLDGTATGRQRADGIERGVDLHALVRGRALAARCLWLAVRCHRPPPSARAGIPGAGAVGVHDDGVGS